MRTESRPTWRLPNRIATTLLVVFGIAGAALPAAANMDWQSTAGVLAGLGAVSAAIVTWLKGWYTNEAENRKEYLAGEPPADVAELRDRVTKLVHDFDVVQADVDEIKRVTASQ